MNKIRAENLVPATALVACSSAESEDICGICLELLKSPNNVSEKSGSTGFPSEREVVKTQVCCHFFHRGCIELWFLNANWEKHNTCPYCRTVLFGMPLASADDHDDRLAAQEDHEESYLANRWDVDGSSIQDLLLDIPPWVDDFRPQGYSSIPTSHLMIVQRVRNSETPANGERDRATNFSGSSSQSTSARSESSRVERNV